MLPWIPNSLREYIHGRPRSITASGPQHIWQMGVCVSETMLRSHICYWKSWLLSQTRVTCWDSQPQVHLFRLLSHLLSGLKWTIPGKQARVRINQVKQVRSESRLTTCPFLIKFNSAYLNKIDQHCHQCAPILWQKCVVKPDKLNKSSRWKYWLKSLCLWKQMSQKGVLLTLAKVCALEVLSHLCLLQITVSGAKFCISSSFF